MKPTIIVHGGAGSGRYGEHDRRFLGLKLAVEEGMQALRKGSGLDGAVAAVSYMEGSGLFNCGKGACLTSGGKLELDAAVMSGSDLAGAGVGGVTCTYHPVQLARWVMENTKHVLIAGNEAKNYARAAGMKTEKLYPSKGASSKFETLRKDVRHAEAVELARKLEGGGTVGAVAIGSDGVPAAAVSTGGMWMKLPGRVGDSAILGAGIFADAKSGAACATGTGEEIIRMGLSMKACELMKESGAAEAAREAISVISRARGKGTAGIITIDLRGRQGAAYNTDAMGRAWYDSEKEKVFAKV